MDSTHGTYRLIGAGLSRMIARLARGRAALFAAALLAGGLPQTAAAEPITEFPLPGLNSSPNRITVGPDGALWFAEQSRGKLGRITTSGTITETAFIPTA